jgi:PAS domain-containing protein
VFENKVLRRIFGLKRDEVMGGWRKREEHGLRVFENRVLGRIFGPKRDEVTGEWRKMHNGELRPKMEVTVMMSGVRSAQDGGN